MVDDTSPFLEVFCEVSGKDYRFTTGTKAEFAVSVINRKLGSLKPRVIYIEAAKEGEEPISFGDNASLLNYGLGWKLKTVVDADLPGTEKNNRQQRFSSVFSTGFANDSTPEIGEQSLKYIGRIFFAFVLMFILGGLFTVALENLPRLILLFNNSSV
ncbi:hypothetical protein ISN44_As05g031270 [Arabidopsis suecica]|uniref:Uncharacterized protein n=1 Tax=Arabidopsis suecica TaxID=45249 RepID=A0A8T2DHX6_ARASU|nr:hypothetical protein ISN44_As05g031270 [Arabidopsis suecica]